MALIATTGCRYTTIRADLGYRTPVGDGATGSEGGYTATGGLGGEIRNRRARLAVTAEYAARPAADATLFSIEGDVFLHRFGVRTLTQPGRTVTEKRESGIGLLGRASFGPAFGDATSVGEWSLGVGLLGDSVVDDRDQDMFRYYFASLALEAVATRTSFPDHAEWMLGGRVSFVIPGNVLGFFIDGWRSQ